MKVLPNWRTMRLARGGKYSLNSPSSRQARNQRIERYVKATRPLSDGQGFTLKLKKVAAASVVLLLDACCPTAIVRIVVGVVVSALDAMRCAWALASNVFSVRGKGDILRLHKNLHFLCQAWGGCNRRQAVSIGVLPPHYSTDTLVWEA